MLTLAFACTTPEPPADEASPPASLPDDGSTPQDTPAHEHDPPGSVQGGPLEVCINEFMPTNRVSAYDESGLPADWIELHNPTALDVPLDGWSLTDDPAEPTKHVLSGGLVLAAGGYQVLWADTAPDAGSDHLGFALEGEGETIGLFAPDGTGSLVTYGHVTSDLSVARVTDCCFDEAAGCFAFVFAGTPGATNGD